MPRADVRGNTAGQLRTWVCCDTVGSKSRYWETRDMIRISLMMFCAVVACAVACGPPPASPQVPPVTHPASGIVDPYWCYRGMQTPVMEGQPPPCPDPIDAGSGPGR